MKHLKSILTLFIICAVVSVLLAVVNGVTAPIIAEQQAAAASGALLEVMPDGGTFEKMDISGVELPATIVEANKSSNGGYVFQVSFTGFNPGNVAMIGVSADGKVTGTKCITNAESSGFGADAIPELDSKGHYNGVDVTTIDGVDTVAGVTVSTKAYLAVVKDALNAAIILGGGEVDIRTPEQILNDNLNAALGTEGVEFDKHFAIEYVEGVDAIYIAKSGEGHVVVLNGNYIGVVDGEVVGAIDSEANEITVSEEDQAMVGIAVESINVTSKEFDFTKFDVSSNITSVEITDSGVYVIKIKAEGYGVHGEYNSSGEHILIRVAITSEGKMIACETLYQNETHGYGTPCQDSSFYDQFVGKTQDDYTDTRTDVDMSEPMYPNEERKEYVSDIDAITGATVTSTGYKVALMHAFNAVKIFEGGAK